MPPERRAVARASRACTYCRQRKMRCTGERPRCKNCEIYDEECVFATSARKPRPTNAALNALLEENRRLREGSSAQPPKNVDFDGTVQPEQLGSPATPPHERGLTPVGKMATPNTAATPGETPRSTDGTSTYHGPTSTLHDDTVPVSRSWLSKERESWMPKLLVAAAAEQRQYEGINARSGKLDFDSVEPELGLHLLHLHWNRQHHSFLITYRPAFMRDMACNGPYFSKILLNAIYYGASKFSPRLELRKDPSDVRTAGWRFRNRVRDLLGPALDHSEITTIQALLQMSNSLFALGDEQSAAWVYAGTAFRMLLDLGLHVDATSLPNAQRISEEDLEVRRRVYWSAFVVDKMQSLYQGRPASLSPRDGQVPITFMDTYEELEFWQPFAYTNGIDYPGSPSYSISTFKELCNLCVVLHDVLGKMYCERKRGAEDLVQDRSSLENRLQDWKAMLPDHLRIRFDGEGSAQQLPPPHVFSLQAMWNTLRVLLHRPFVANGNSQATSSSTSKSSFTACAEAARNIVQLVRLYDKAFSIRRAPYLISYATYVAATIHVRIAATRNATSDAHEHLRTCLSVFSQNSETNYAVRKASVVIEALMTRMGVAIAPSGSGSTSSSNGDIESARGTSTALSDRQLDAIRPGADGSVTNPLEAAESFANIEPTMIAGQFVPDLDIDAIIHSFMQDQQLQGVNTMQISAGGPPGYSSDATWQGASDLNYATRPQGGTGNFDDALFGFNASAFDWFQPNVMSA